MSYLAPDYIAELALIETSKQQREALERLMWKPRKDNPLVSKLWKMKE